MSQLCNFAATQLNFFAVGIDAKLSTVSGVIDLTEYSSSINIRTRCFFQKSSEKTIFVFSKEEFCFYDSHFCRFMNLRSSIEAARQECSVFVILNWKEMFKKCLRKLLFKFRSLNLTKMSLRDNLTHNFLLIDILMSLQVTFKASKRDDEQREWKGWRK